MSASTLQLRLHNETQSSSLTLYAQDRTANPLLLPRLADRKNGAKLPILPTKMTNGFSGGSQLNPVDTKTKDPENNRSAHRRHKTYVSCLQTSLSTNWKRSLSQESEEKDLQSERISPANDEMSAQKKDSANKTEKNNAPKKNPENSATSKGPNSQSANACRKDLDSTGAKEKRETRETREKRLEHKDVHVSVQPGAGKQLTIISGTVNGGCVSAVTSYDDGNLPAASTKSCTSYVYIKSKFKSSHSSNDKNSKVVVQKSPLCRSITISEASLSSAMSRQAESRLAAVSKKNERNLRATRSRPAISVQNKSKRSFTVSLDSTDGKLRTIYESAIEETTSE